MQGTATQGGISRDTKSAIHNTIYAFCILYLLLLAKRFRFFVSRINRCCDYGNTLNQRWGMTVISTKYVGRYSGRYILC